MQTLSELLFPGPDQPLWPLFAQVSTQEGGHAGVSWLLGVGYEEAQGTGVEAHPPLCMLTWAPGRQQLWVPLLSL